MLADQFGVAADLGGVGRLLFLQRGADTAVRRHPKNIGPALAGRDDGDVFAHLARPPFLWVPTTLPHLGGNSYHYSQTVWGRYLSRASRLAAYSSSRVNRPAEAALSSKRVSKIYRSSFFVSIMRMPPGNSPALSPTG